MTKAKEIEPLDLTFEQAVKAVVRGATKLTPNDKLKKGQPDSPTARQPDSPTARQPDSPTGSQGA